MAQGFSLKDRLLNAEKTRYLAGLFAEAEPGFDADTFEHAVVFRLPELELKQRIAWIAECLGAALPGSLPDVAPVVRAALPPPLDPQVNDGEFGDFIFAPVGELVVARGLDEHPDLVLDLLEEITQRFSMEWAIRPVLNRWAGPALARMMDWTDHPSTHVRRLVSEGTRPRLPWGQPVTLRPQDPLPLLDRLHGDPTRYVTRSVANHLNDVSKSHPDMAMDRLARWQGVRRQTARELDWMTGHALRGLVKRGEPRAVKMLGYDPEVELDVTLEIDSGPVRIGDALRFACRIEARDDTRVLVDYVIHFLRPSGKVSAKVFKLKKARVAAGQPLELSKRHGLKADATTFTLVPGRHRLELQINGRSRATANFDLSP